MHRVAIAAVITGLCSPVLLACSNDATAGDPTPPPTTPSATATSPVTTPPATTSSPTSPTAPAFPPLAKHRTVAGAKAFAAYYIASQNYAWTVGRGVSIVLLSTRACAGCRALASTIDRFTARGGYNRGAKWHPLYLVAVPTQPERLPVISATIDVDEGTWRSSSSGQIHHSKAATVHDDFHLVWSAGGWLVQRVVSQ